MMERIKKMRVMNTTVIPPPQSMARRIRSEIQAPQFAEILLHEMAEKKKQSMNKEEEVEDHYGHMYAEQI